MPLFQIRTRSRNGVSRTRPRAGRSNTNRSHSFERLVGNGDERRRGKPEPAERPPDERNAGSLRCRAVSFGVPCASAVPFAQRLRVARRDVGIFRIAADRRRDLPGARALRALGEIDDDGDARARRAGGTRRAALRPSTSVAAEVMQTSARSMSTSAREQIGVGHVHDRVRLRARSRCAWRRARSRARR